MATTRLIAPSGYVPGSQVQTGFGNYTIGADGTVTVDSRVVSSLLGAGYTIFSDDLPVGKAVAAGSHTTTAGEATAGTLDIVTGLSSVDTMLVQVLDAGNNVVTADADVTEAAGTITVADGVTYNTVDGQVINWIAYGAA